MKTESTKVEASVLDDTLAIARRVLKQEVQGLEDLIASLNGDFIKAVETIEAASGRVIVSGMGKSGHIARKIAATLASTGTPAYFVHPAEASHGDLGMIAVGDVVLALSNSGETEELGNLIAYTRRFAIPLIGVTRRAGSTLANRSDVALVVPASPEACASTQAPTTSTTVMLALGDALAVTLIERRGFSAEDFQVYHPGGSLGRRLLRVGDLMHAAGELPLVEGNTVMAQALLVMTQKSFGCVGVIDPDGCLEGIITDGDLRRHMSADLLDRSARDCMTPRPLTTVADELAAKALATMNARKITGLFVVENGRPTGFLHIHDCLRAGIY